ncbi:MAG: hypothetical protein HQL39_19495 [Alphaproteobacteria bacterium]|nr:hypothetical protein [Alphaproteobacteria bacterium]
MPRAQDGGQHLAFEVRGEGVGIDPPVLLAAGDGGRRVAPFCGRLKASQTIGIGGQRHRRIVKENGGAEHEGFGGIERVVFARDERRHLPERVEMGDVVDGQPRNAFRNFLHQNVGLLAHPKQRLAQLAAWCRMRVPLALVGKGFRPEGGVGKRRRHSFGSSCASAPIMR